MSECLQLGLVRERPIAKNSDQSLPRARLVSSPWDSVVGAPSQQTAGSSESGTGTGCGQGMLLPRWSCVHFYGFVMEAKEVQSGLYLVGEMS